MRTRYIIPSLLLAFTMIVSSLHCYHTSSIEELIIDNGSFELGLQSWKTYSYGYGDAEIVPGVAYDGEYSLRTYTVPGPEVPKFPYGGGAYQIIERDDLTLDLRFSFWVRPGIVGENQFTQIRTWIEFHTQDGQILRLAYYIAWGFHVPENPRFNTTDTTYILIRDCKIGVWNHVERDLKSDFESRFGTASEYSLSTISLYADLAHYWSVIIANAYWDAFTLTLTTTTPPKTYSVTILVSDLPSTYATNVVIDDRIVGEMTGGSSSSFEFEAGTSHKFSVDEYVEGDAGVRYHCIDNDVAFTESGTHTFTYVAEYYLTVNSQYSNAKGSGWYPAGSTASFSIDESSISFEGALGALGARYVFERWTGDSSSTNPSASVEMDGPKTVTALWREDYGNAYAIIIGAPIIVAILLVLAFSLRRKRRAIPTEVIQVPTPTKPSRAPTTRYCIHCGSEIPSDAKFCGVCSRDQSTA